MDGQEQTSHGRGRWFNPSRAHHKINGLERNKTGGGCSSEHAGRRLTLAIMFISAIIGGPVALSIWYVGHLLMFDACPHLVEVGDWLLVGCQR